jgi:hypothetical protein
MDNIEILPNINRNYLVIELIVLFFCFDQIPGNQFSRFADITWKHFSTHR